MPSPEFTFSVVIPTKDRPDMLRRALLSVLAQRDATFEIVVADDGSGQGIEVAKAIVRDRALTAFETGRQGQVPARNMAIRRARGAWIAFLDDDDWWADAHHLAAMAAVRASDARFAYCSGRIVREGPGVSADDWIPFRAEIDGQSIRKDNCLLISGIAYDRRLHDFLGPLDESLAVYWDWDWYLRVASAGIGWARADAAGVRISARSDNVSAPANELLRRSELLRLAAKHGLTDLVLKNHEIIALEQAS